MWKILITIPLNVETHIALLKAYNIGIRRATFLLGMVHHAYQSVRPEALHADIIQLLPLSCVQATAIQGDTARITIVADEDVIEELFKISNEDFYVQEL